MPKSKNRRIVRILIGVVVLLWVVITVIKFRFLGYRFDSVIPRRAVRVTIGTRFSGNGDDISVSHFLPSMEVGQRIEKERITGDFSTYTITSPEGNRRISYESESSFGHHTTAYTCRAHTRRVVYDLPDFSRKSDSIAPYLEPWLTATDLIQKDDSVIHLASRELGIEQEENRIRIIQKVFDYCYHTIRKAGFSGETDAVLACKLGEASCNGKSRLMVALCRSAGIPARLVGGIILQGGKKRTSHQWVEVFIESSWVPFCPLNGYFAEKPWHYLSCYRGDHAFFLRTADIRFDYSFLQKSELVPGDETLRGHKLLDIINIWRDFPKAGIPLNILSIVLMIPIGALVTIIFRNVIGVQTFGTFLPALIAYAFMGTGLFWGTIVFSGLILTGALLNSGLSRLHLLHTPRLTIIMVWTVLVLLFLGVCGISHGRNVIAQAFFFPLAILSITIERFLVITQERGLQKSCVILCWTLVVVAFCYMVMSSLFLQMVIVVMPETYLLVVGAALYFGHWTGLRVSELIRFRGLLFEKDGG